MRISFAPLQLADAAVRLAAKLRPSDTVVRALVTLGTAALTAVMCGMVLHPVDTVAQASSAQAAASAVAPLRTGPSLPATHSPHLPKIAASQAVTASGLPAKRSADEAATPPDRVPTERLVWDRAPLQVALGVGPERERSITFPAPMHVGVPHEVAPLLRLQTVGRTTYLTALAPFPRTRVIAEDRASGSVILLDLTASKATTAMQPLQVVVPSAAGPDSLTAGDEDARLPVDMVTLTRFAAQQMYASRRLTGSHPGIRRVMVDGKPLEDLYAGGGVRGTPAAQWRGDEFYVTAVVLQNLRPHPLELDPLDVRGRWRAITFQHGRLLAHGSEADTTVVYLVCEQPFEACR